MNTNTFIDELKYLDAKSIKSAKLIPLIQIGYFTEFGNENTLLHFINYWDLLKQGTAKQVSKEKASLDPTLEHLLSKYAKGTNKDGSESKSWTIIDMDNLLDELYAYCTTDDAPSYATKMKWQNDVLGYIELTTGKEEDTKRILIIDVKPLISQYSPDPWCYKIETRSIGTGRTASLNVDAKTWERYGTLTPMDIIKVGRVGKNKKGYWYIYDYQKEN